MVLPFSWTWAQLKNIYWKDVNITPSVTVNINLPWSYFLSYTLGDRKEIHDKQKKLKQMEQMGMLFICKIRLVTFMSPNITSLIFMKHSSSNICTDWLHFMEVCLESFQHCGICQLYLFCCPHKAVDKTHKLSELSHEEEKVFLHLRYAVYYV